MAFRRTTEYKICDQANSAARFVVHSLAEKFGPQWLGGPRAPLGASDFSRVEEWRTSEVPLTRKGFEKTAGCRSLNEVIERFHLRSVREDSQRALVEWAKGRYPIVLIHHIPTPEEMLEIQCEGLRYVTLLRRLEDKNRQIGRHTGALAFLLHDLEHADKFFLDPASYAGQKMFFRCLQRSVHSGTFQQLCREDLFCKDFHYVMADMNSHPLHLFKYLKAIVLMHKLRRAERGSHENLPEHMQQELDDFWRDLLHDWGMNSVQIASAVRINRPQIETPEDILVIASFFASRREYVQ